MPSIKLENNELYDPSTASQASCKMGVIAHHAPPASPLIVVSEMGVIAQHAPPTSSQRVSDDGTLGPLLKEYTLALSKYYRNDADPSVDKASNVRSLHDTVAGLLQWLRIHGYREHWLAEEADAVVQASRDHAERLARGHEGSPKKQSSSELCTSQFALRELSLGDPFVPENQGQAYVEGEYYPSRRHSVPDTNNHRDHHRRARYDTHRGPDCYRPKYD